jgi:hypothetical protein
MQKSIEKPDLTRLHVVIPKSLFLRMREAGMLREIDNIATNLLWAAVLEHESEQKGGQNDGR